MRRDDKKRPAQAGLDVDGSKKLKGTPAGNTRSQARRKPRAVLSSGQQGSTPFFSSPAAKASVISAKKRNVDAAVQPVAESGSPSKKFRTQSDESDLAFLRSVSKPGEKGVLSSSGDEVKQAPPVAVRRAAAFGHSMKKLDRLETMLSASADMKVLPPAEAEALTDSVKRLENSVASSLGEELQAFGLYTDRLLQVIQQAHGRGLFSSEQIRALSDKLGQSSAALGVLVGVSLDAGSPEEAVAVVDELLAPAMPHAGLPVLSALESAALPMLNPEALFGSYGASKTSDASTNTLPAPESAASTGCVDACTVS